MSTERIDIVVSENGSRTVKRNLEDVGKAGRGAGAGVELLKKALFGLGVAGAAAFLRQQVDEYTNLNNRLKLVTTSAENLRRVNDELFASANRTRSEYSATVELYGSLARASKQLGLGQKDLLAITETVNQAIQISGTDAATASNGLRQLGQGLASGTLRGDELNSVLENMPRLATAIADGMGITVGQLRKFGAEGKITAGQITEALKKEAPAIAEEYAKISPTIASAFTVLKNNVLRFIGDADQANGASRLLAQGLLLIGNNLGRIIPMVIAFGAAWATIRLASTIQAVLGPMIALERALGASSALSAVFSIAMKTAQGAVRSFTASLLANPFTALAVAVLAITTAIISFGDQVAVTADGAVTLKDAFFATLSLIGDLVRVVAGAFGAAWSAATSLVSALFARFGTSASEVLSKLWTFVKGVVNGYIGIWKTAIDTVVLIWNNFPGAVNAVLTVVTNAVATAAEYAINAWQMAFRGIASLLSYVSQDTADALNAGLDAMTVTLPRAQFSAAGKQFAEDFTRTAKDNLQRDYLGELGNAIVERARRNKGDGSQGALEAGGTPSPLAADDGKKKGHKETREEFLKRVNDQTRNSTELAKSMSYEYGKVDEDIVSIGEHLADRKWARLSEGEESALRAKLKAMYDEQDAQERRQRMYEQFADPQRELERNEAAINAVVARFPQYADQSVEALRRLRIEFLRTKTDTASGLQLGKLQVQQDNADNARRVAGAYRDEYGQANGALQEIGDRVTALKQLMQDDPINSGQYAQRIRELGLEALQLRVNLPGATVWDAMRGGFARFVQDYKGMLPGLQDAFANTFNQIADGAANALSRAIVYGENLGSALKAVAADALQQLLGALIKLGIQWLVMQVIGQTAMSAVGATGIAMGIATAAAWAPAAAAVSLASFGANAGPAMVGIATTFGLTKALSIAGAFADGGPIMGRGGPRQDNLLAFVSNGEYVMNAEATRAFRPILDAMNYGGRLPAFASGGPVGGSGRMPTMPMTVSGGSEGGDQFHLHIGSITSNDPEMVREQVELALDAALPVFLVKAKQAKDKDERENGNRQRIGGGR